MSPEGQLGEPQLLADERCPTFTGFTDDAFVLRCREGFKLVQLPGGRVQATLPFARLGVAKGSPAANRVATTATLLFICFFDWQCQ